MARIKSAERAKCRVIRTDRKKQKLSPAPRAYNAGEKGPARSQWEQAVMNAEFRANPSKRREWRVMAILFSAIAFFILAIPFAQLARHSPQRTSSDPLPSWAAFSLFLPMGGIMLAFAYFFGTTGMFESLAFRGTTFTYRKRKRDHDFALADLERFVWRFGPKGGGVNLFWTGRKLQLEMGLFAEEDHLPLIRALREFVPESRQEGWPQYCRVIALKLRDGQAAVDSCYPNVKSIMITRKRYDRIAVLVLPISTVITALLWNW